MKKLRADCTQIKLGIPVQNLLFSSLLLKNIKLKIHRNIILSVDVYEIKTCILTK